jgi:hypothetical protein
MPATQVAALRSTGAWNASASRSGTNRWSSTRAGRASDVAYFLLRSVPGADLTCIASSMGVTCFL